MRHRKINAYEKRVKKKMPEKKYKKGKKLVTYLMFTCSALTEDGFSS